ncbi:hypothetical protein ABD81_29955 [Bacillus thuringiensis]|uniref:Uncharacterized protein n=1 Tax=Bacillus wiedmannii TaxID=1890302 RepID=A0A242YZ37_9BACI|nr:MULTISPECIES: hypothetical protein [Bacillus cereus group]MBG9749524.1 hypothetical protein [Bacillus thuringiensis]MBG9781967.1 hypothetical protein [Bacillus thuringiensis]OTX84891.1 hypothetical protein BK730_24255 [Bacillus wiedmannii]OTZ80694.1 hypothetical protein BK771_33040 [Bacillus thuringiensis serovar ostriniae]
MKLLKKGIFRNKKFKYGFFGVLIVLAIALVLYLENLSAEKEEIRSKGGPPQITKSEKELMTKFMTDFFTFLNNNEVAKAQAVSKVEINEIHPAKKEYPDETITASNSYSISKIGETKFKVVGSEKIKNDNETIGKRKSTYVIEELNSKYYITKFKYEFEKEMLEPEIKLIKQHSLLYTPSHGKVELIGEIIDPQQKRFNVAIKYKGSQPEQFIHTFASIGDSQTGNNLNLLYGISDNGVKLFADQTEVRKYKDDVVVIFSGDAKEEKNLSRIDYISSDSLNKVLSGDIQLDKEQVKQLNDYAPVNLIGKDEKNLITIPEQNHLNIDIKPDFNKETAATNIHIDSIVYDNIKGMVVKGYAINKSDLVLNFDESTQEKQKVDQLKVYSPYQFEMIKFDDDSVYEKNLYQHINSAFVLRSKVKLTEDDSVVKFNLFNVPFCIDLKTGKELPIDANEFKSLEGPANFNQ